MSSRPDHAPDTVEAPPTCYLHPETETRLRCSRCNRPICGRCATPASVGQHCPECVGEARRAAPRVRSAMRANAPAVFLIVAANVVIFLLQMILGDSFTTRFYSDPGEIAGGEWWRLVTAMFLHAPFTFFHILFNMMALWIYGPDVEQAFGSLRFVVMYLVAGFAGSAVSYAFGSCTPGLGASGAIFGVIGILLVYLFNRRRSAMAGRYMRGVLGILGINLLIGLWLPGIDVLAHAGGLAGGIVVGAGFDQGGSSKPSPAVQAATAVTVLAVAVGLVVWRGGTILC